MSKKLIYLISFVLVAGPAFLNIASGAEPNLVGWWKFDEKSGTTAYDSSGIGSLKDGTLNGKPQWVAGYRGGALKFNPSKGNDYVSFPQNNFGTLIKSLKESTFSIWVNWSGTGGGWQRIFDFGSATENYIYLCPSTGAADAAMRVAIVAGNGIWDEFDSSSGPLTTGWHHIAVTVSDSSKTMTMYLDGNVVGSKTDCTNSVDDLGTTTNNWLGRSEYDADPCFNGSLDDFRIYNRVLSQVEIKKVANPEKTSVPIPADGSIINQTVVTLRWQPGIYAANVNGHHVYFGEVFNDVNQSTGGTDKGFSTAPNYNVPSLTSGKTYYWRVNEANGVNIWRGDIWSFRVQP